MQIQLTNSTVKILKKMHSQALYQDGLLTLRIVGIFRLAEGYSCGQTALMLSVSVRAVERWRHKFVLYGASGLLPGKASGAKSRLTAAQRQALYAMIVAGPESCGYTTSCWRGMPRVVRWWLS